MLCKGEIVGVLAAGSGIGHIRRVKVDQGARVGDGFQKGDRIMPRDLHAMKAAGNIAQISKVAAHVSGDSTDACTYPAMGVNATADVSKATAHHGGVGVGLAL